MEGLKRYKTITKILIFFTLAFLFFVIVVLGIFVVIFWIGVDNEQKVIMPGDESIYRMLNYNIMTDESTVSFVTLPDEIDDFLFQKNNDHLVLISNFETTQYKCTGTCYCENSSEEYPRRGTLATKFSKGLTYLVAATTSFIAYKRAQSYFDQECKNENEDFCDGAIISELEHCEFLIDDPVGREMFENEMDKKPQEYQYHCFGNCLPAIGDQNEAVSFEFCEKYRLDSDVDVSVMSLVVEVDRKLTATLGVKKLAHISFVKNYLHPYCVSSSVLQKNGPNTCSGKGHDSIENPTVNCFELPDWNKMEGD